MRIPLPKLRELVEALRAVFGGPYTTKFPKEVDSVHPNFRGILKFNEDKCICCGACSNVCPTNAREIVVDRDKGVLRNVHHAERCIYCGQCVRYCTVGDGIEFTTEFDTARTERSEDWETAIEKEVAHCEKCGEPFAAREHLVYTAQKEYAEGCATLSLITDSTIPDPDELGVDYAAYMNGIAEAVGELRRHILDLIRKGDIARCEELLEAMDDIYGVLVTMDFPDALTGGLRRTTDTMRSIMERTRGDLTVTARQWELEDRLDGFEKKLK